MTIPNGLLGFKQTGGKELAKGVFLHRADSIYEDQPEERYQFPKSYLKAASQCIGDWIIYLEPTKAGKNGYYAVAQVKDIIPDPEKSGMFVALIEPGTYLPFERSVPFSVAGDYPELSVLNDFGRVSGRAQAAMRVIPEADFNRIVSRGIPDEDSLLPRVGAYAAEGNGVAEERSPFVFEQVRDRTAHLTNRIVRDRVFRSKVLQAYDSTCAFTSLRLINGGGRAEAEAAHIRPVEANGPDIVSNGIALSGTVHWMFDRGLLSLSDELEILVSRHINDQSSIQHLLNPSGRASLPLHLSMRPHPRFLEWHRQYCFKA